MLSNRQDNAVMQDINDLIIFARIVELHGFSAAARSLGIPKSNVSYRMARLEERLGVRLLQRSTRQVSVTEIGNTYYKYCARIAAEASEAEVAIRDMQATPRGLLRISMPIAFGCMFVVPLIIEFMTRYPEVRVKMVSTSRRVDIIEENFDVVIRIGRLASSSLIARHLGVLRQHLYASSRYLTRQGTPNSIEDLDAHECFVLGESDDSGQWTLVEGSRQETVSLSPRGAANDPVMLRSLVVGGLGIALMPDLLCWQEEEDGKLVRVLPEWSGPPLDFHVLYPSHRGIPLVVRTFLDFIIKRLSVLDDTSGGKPVRVPHSE